MVNRFDSFPMTAGPRVTPAVNLQQPTAVVQHVLRMVYGVSRRVPTVVEEALSSLMLWLKPAQRGQLLAALDGAARAAASGAVQDEGVESMGFARQTAAALGLAPRRDTLGVLAELASTIFSAYRSGAIVSGPGVEDAPERNTGYVAFGWDAEGVLFSLGYENEEDALNDTENLIGDNSLVSYYVISVTAPKPRVVGEVDLPDLPAAQIRLRE